LTGEVIIHDINQVILIHNLDYNYYST
jgi:hypothetical protein